MADSPMDAGASNADAERVRAKWIAISQGAPDEQTRDTALRELARLAIDHPVNMQPQGIAPSDRGRGYDIPPDQVQMQETPIADKALSAGSRALDTLEAGASGFNDRFAFGLPSRALEATGLQPREQRQAIEERSPVATQLGQGTGMGADALLGPGALIGKLGTRAAVALAPELGASTLGRVAQTAGAGALGAGTYRLADAAVQGAPIEDQLIDGGKGAAAGALVGLGGEALGGLAGGASRLLRRNNQIGTRAAAQEAGLYDRPEMQALPPGEEGNRRAAEMGLDRVLQRDQQLGQEAGQRYQQAVGPHLGQPVDREALVRQLRAEMMGNVDPDTAAMLPNGAPAPGSVPLRPQVQGALQGAVDRTPANPTVQGTLARRRAMQQDAAFDSPNPTPEQQGARDIYGTFRQGVRNSSPEVAAADDAFSNYARTAARRRDILFNTEDNVMRGGNQPTPTGDQILPEDAMAPTMRVGKEKAAATTLGRVGDENVPGLQVKRYLEELAAQDPEFAAALDMIAAKKAQEATRFGLHGHSPLSLHGATEFHGLGPLIRQNARAIGATAEQGLRGSETMLQGLTGAPQQPLRVRLPNGATGGGDSNAVERRLRDIFGASSRLPTTEEFMNALLDARQRRQAP